MNMDDVAQEIKTPLSVMLEMARSEIETNVLMCMDKNNIPPDLMEYILKSVLLDIVQIKTERISKEYVTLQATANQKEVTDNGDSDAEGRVR